MAQTIKWSAYAPCERCEASAGAPCVSMGPRNAGSAMGKPHPGRRLLTAETVEVPELPLEEYPVMNGRKAVSVAAKSEPKQTHHIEIGKSYMVGFGNVFWATCTCGDFAGDMFSTDDAAEMQGYRHALG